MAQIKKLSPSFFDITAILLITVSYASQKMIEFFVPSSKTLAIILAMVHTALLFVTVLLISRSENSYYALFSAVLGFKMMPVDVLILAPYSVDASMLYYIVKRVALCIFVVLIYKIYREQKDEAEHINSLPIIVLLATVPFFYGFSAAFTDYFLEKTGSMLYGYFSAFACYAAATLVILAVGYISSASSMRFVAGYEIAALGINFLRRVGKIALNLINGVHVSKSLYVWAALYVVLAITALVACKMKMKKSEA